MPADVTFGESIQWLEKPDYNRGFISGQKVGVLAQVTRVGTAGDVLAPMVVDALITQAAGARQLGIAVLADTGRPCSATSATSPRKVAICRQCGLALERLGVDHQPHIDE